jgi:5-carboxyvanillate decarboxylase
MKKIAVEEHILTPKYLEYLRSRGKSPRRESIVLNGKKLERQWTSDTKFRLLDPAQSDKRADIQECLKDMDDAGIDMQVLSLNFPGVERFEPENAVEISRVVNEELYDITRRYPLRFAAFASIAPQAPAAAAEELERAVTGLGMKGALVTGHINGQYLDETKFQVILKTAERLDVPLYLHPGMPGPSMIQPYLGYCGLSDALLGFAADASLHAMRLILGGTFDRYPRLKIILGHLGEAIPFWLWRLDSRIDEVIKNDPAAREQYRNLSKSPSQYFKENFYVTTSGMYWKPALEFVCSVLGSDRVLFATDYPHESGRDAVAAVESTGRKVNKSKVFHQNAQELLHLK